MSFTRSPYDMCSYKYQLAESVGSGVYQLVTPQNQLIPILPRDPRYIAQKNGVSINKNTSLIDIDSELIGISRNLSDCPDRKYMPNTNSQTGKVRSGCQSGDKLCVDTTQVMHFADNGMWTEDSRLSNPPSTLRGTGWNRFEWLPMDPQDRVIEPFDYQIHSKMLSKDNHRPCVPKPMNQFNAYPTPNNTPICETIIPVCHAPTMPPSVSWQREDIIARY